jgi:hypothetical protein
MAVVINEFEVVPADDRPREPARPAEAATSSQPPKDAERELDRMLFQRRIRAARRTAV